MIWSLAGCQPPPDPFIDLADAKSSTLQVDDLQRSMELVLSTQSYEIREYEQKVSQGLNRWIDLLDDKAKQAVDSASATIDDPQFTRWLETYQDLPTVARFRELNFVGSDAHFLREKYWLGKIAQRVIDTATIQNLELYRLIVASQNGEESADTETDKVANDVSLAELVQRVHPEVAPDQLKSLQNSLLLFDWVVRNIQLESTPTANDESNQALFADREQPARAGIRGLGYTKQVWQILLYGRGDYVDRAKLFVGLCEQAGLPAAVLTIGQTPWVVAVQVGDQAYLFDTRLGLGVPVPDSGRVATLNELRQHPEWLAQLNLSLDETTREDSKYWVTADDLSKAAAWILISPESVSRRMQFLESRLVGDQKLKLVSRPSAFKEGLSKAWQVPVEFWDLDFQAHAFRETLQSALAQSNSDNDLAAKLGWYYSNYQYIDLFAPYRNARNLFLLGQFKSERNSRVTNAVESFFNLIYSDKTIEELSFNKPLLTRLGILQSTDQNAAVFNERVRSVQQQMYLVREDMGLFLSQVHFDNGNFGTSGNWLGRINEQASNEQANAERWKPAIRYLLARTQEVGGDLQAACELYKSSDSPQFHGEMLRRRILQRALDAEKQDSETAQ